MSPPKSLAALRFTYRDLYRHYIAIDRAGEDYALSRDRTMKSNIYIERYTFKDLRDTQPHNRTRSIDIRIPMGRYLGCLIGTISEWYLTSHQHRLFQENWYNTAQNCRCITICRPVGTDQATVEFYDRQVAALKNLIDDDLASEPGVVERSWVKQDENGADLIELLSFNFRELLLGSDADIQVCLSKDQYRDSTGTLFKSYTLWQQDHRVLTDKDVGRV
ncbi:hypothetical protein R3P38DRAFT_2792223 [Favolaschia claudopus]|uniref:Uncharacterized protein n=1 Tax=Favolaschia claudopus TaxID=2862362 RepID=A0AAW0AGG7_9AGAR